MGSKVIIMRDKMPEPFARILQLLRLHPLPELLPDGFPEALALAESLRMVRAGDDVPDPFLIE